MCPCVWSASPDAIVEVSFILTWTLTPSLQSEFCVNWDLTDVTNTWLSKRFVTKYLWLILIPLSLPWANSRGLSSDSILTPGQHEDGGWSLVEDRDKLWSGYISTSEVCRPEGRLAPSLLNAQCKFTDFESKILQIFEDERPDGGSDWHNCN